MKDLRIKFKLIASTDQPQDPAWGLFKLRAAELVSKFSGGCTVYNALGYWTPEATENKNQYAGVKDESAFVLEVSFDQNEGAPSSWHRLLVNTYAKAKADTGAKVQWIHCERTNYIANHFEI